MKENSYILHCYDNLVAMTTSNNCIFSLAVYSSLSPCICVQYRGGTQYLGGVQYRGGYHEHCGGCLEYRGGVQYRGDILSTVGVFSTVGDIMSTVGLFSTVGGYYDARGGIP